MCFAGERQAVLIMEDGKAIEAVVLEPRKYWLKVRDSSARTIYINKAFVKAVEMPK